MMHGQKNIKLGNYMLNEDCTTK